VDNFLQKTKTYLKQRTDKILNAAFSGITLLKKGASLPPLLPYGQFTPLGYLTNNDDEGVEAERAG
jgi:hypothetical protein